MDWGEEMNQRQIKKNSKTAMQLLKQLSPKDYPEDCFDRDEVWQFWYQCGGECPEWDCESAYDQLITYLHSNLSDGDVSDDLEWVWNYQPDLSTAKKAFNLAKKMIE